MARVGIRATGEPASSDYFRKCLACGTKAGGDGAAIRRASDDVRAFVRTVFKLPGA
jgi:hypothetical protein